MKAVLQRVSEAAVTIDGAEHAKIGPGLVILLCVEPDDDAERAAWFARKIAHMRIFADAAGKSNLSVRDVGGAALVISQFTLAADWRKGNRPGYARAAAPELAKRLYDDFCARLSGHGVPVVTGVFGADMKVRLTNDGPVTIWMDSRDR